MLPQDLWDKLLPFQRTGVLFAISRRGRALIADDMGLGKTIQAISIACCYRYEWPCLVITPSSLRDDWVEGFKKWASSTVDPWKIKIVDKVADMKEKGLVFVISYTLAARLVEDLKKKEFKVIIAVSSPSHKGAPTFFSEIKCCCCFVFSRRMNHIT